MSILITVPLCFLLGFLYLRYYPVRGVKCSNTVNLDKDSIKIVDVRDYARAHKDPIQESINIPIAYLKRNYLEITSLNIHVIASNQIDKNISIRFLRKKGFKVKGYTLTECQCNQDIKQKPAS